MPVARLPEGERLFHAIAEAAVTILGAKLARVWADDPAEEVLREKGRFGIDDATVRLLCDRTTLRYHEDETALAAWRFQEETRCVVSFERSFMRPVLG